MSGGTAEQKQESKSKGSPDARLSKVGPAGGTRAGGTPAAAQLKFHTLNIRR
jgi:hypothetical protein